MAVKLPNGVTLALATTYGSNKAISAITDDDSPATLLIERDEFSDELVLQWEEIVSKSRAVSKFEETEAGRLYYFS